MANFFRTPGPMGYNCDHVLRNPKWHPDGDTPLLLRCSHPAIIRFLYADGSVHCVTKRCPACADILKAQAGMGKVQIISETPICEK